MTSLLDLIEGSCALKLFRKRGQFSFAQVFPEKVSFLPLIFLNCLTSAISKFLSVCTSNSTTRSRAAKNFQANPLVYDKGCNRSVSVIFHVCPNLYNFLGLSGAGPGAGLR